MSSTTIEEKNKRASKFDAPGMNFKAKLIGLEDVTDPRGDKMCQVAMAKLKAAVVAIGEHKQRINVNISLEGIKITDDKTTESVLHHHPVHRISFISRDTNDSRAFGYVYNREDGAHQFVGIKTEKAAEPLVTCLRDLFLTVVEMKKEKERTLAKNENNNKVSAEEIKEEQETKKEEIEAEKMSPPSTDLLGLDSGVSGLEQGMGKMNAFDSSSSNVWLDNNLFQGMQPPAAGVVPLQTGALPMVQPGVVIAGTSPFYPHQGNQQMAGIAVASAMYHQPTYPQAIHGMPNAAFGMQPPPFPAHPSSGAGMQTAWPPAQPVAGLMGPGMEARPANQSWMSFDSSTQLSSIFGDLSSPTQTSAGSTVAFSSVPIQPTSAASSNDPFAPTAGAKFPDPFADLAVLQTQGLPQPGKKASKDDFNKDPPKPSLLDLSQQQQRQQTGTDPTTVSSTDPFAAVSLARQSTPYNPFAGGQITSSNNPFASAPSSTLDKSRVVIHPSAQDFNGATDQDDLSTGQVSRPRPKGNTGTRPGLLLPLPSKNNADPFGISSA